MLDRCTLQAGSWRRLIEVVKHEIKGTKRVLGRLTFTYDEMEPHKNEVTRRGQPLTVRGRDNEIKRHGTRTYANQGNDRSGTVDVMNQSYGKRNHYTYQVSAPHSKV